MAQTPAPSPAPLPDLSLSQEAALRCSAAFGLIAYDQRHGYRGPESRLPGKTPAAWAQELAKQRPFSGLEPAIVTQVDKNGLQRTKGGLYQDDMLVVTSKDGKVTKTYYLDMLRTEFLSTAYLAYVLSDTYKVDQLAKTITKPMAESAISDLMAKLTHTPRSHLITATGGKNQGDACAAFAYHGFNGLEADVVGQMADWILAPAR